MKNITITYSYCNEDDAILHEQDIEEEYYRVLDGNPSISREEMIEELVDFCRGSVVEIALDEHGAFEIDIGNPWEIEMLVEEVVDGLWNETEHDYADADGQLHLFDPDEL